MGARGIMPETIYLKEVASGTAFVLTFLIFLPYIISIKKTQTVPHFFSWLIWSFGTFIVFFAQLSDGAGMGAWPIGFSACITCYVAYLSYRIRSKVEITAIDYAFFGLAISAMPAWFFASDPLWAVVLLTLADLLGFGPTLRKAYSHPYDENMGFFALAGARNALVIVALENYSWTTVLFPAAVGVACAFVTIAIYLRRSKVSRANTKIGEDD